LACELPATYDRPLSRWSIGDLVQHVQESGLVASVSGSTLWRWLHEDAIRPWYHRSWVFPRDPDFAGKAGRILDLYARHWQGRALKEDEFVISADEKTSIQARRRKHATQTCRPRTPMHVEHEYFRCGAWTYIAALDGGGLGARRGEVLALRWSDIVDSRATISRSLSQTKVEGLVFKPLKGHEDTEESRGVGVPSETVAKLEAQRKRRMSSTLSSDPTTGATSIWSSPTQAAPR
jgi:integrase